MYETGRVATGGKRQREERRRVPLFWVSVPSCVIMVSLRCDFLNIPVGGCDSDLALRDCCSAALLGSFIPSAFALGAIRGNRRRVSGTSVSFKCGFLPPPPNFLAECPSQVPCQPSIPEKVLGKHRISAAPRPSFLSLLRCGPSVFCRPKPHSPCLPTLLRKQGP
ncbi:hypothetical protein Tb10.70.7120 [Trypanosoma brucei brucei TREU927]|uniref:T. brucei spp.-specific protein n=1 Tax=Trypanosoma brucei brucei (strain 927/4 GUTat10.1) TaxID=185431 RepID=Q38CD9_TRYB2|nr:hypothetical protein Tb10.70.7120 [Trypanosoma brucei brucei TREU927]EAN77531.1 hypothetical protein Tb10.70.7120 [Trypanosoma brucei brucei TREU927]